MHRYHKVTNRGQKISLWDVHYADEIEDWNNRHEKVVTSTPSPNLKHPSSYFNWYYPKYNPFIVFDPRTQQGNPSTSIREFIPDPSPIHTTTQNEPTYHSDFNISQHQNKFKQHKMNRPIIHIKPLTNSKSLTTKHIFHQQSLILTTTHCPTIILTTTNPPTTKTITTHTQIPQHLSHGLISC
jgi:hypothetical protein